MKTIILSLLFSFVSFANNGIEDPKSTIIKVDVKRIVKVQRNVTNSDGKTGVYIYYVKPGEPNFNVSCHRKFLTDKEAFDLRIK